MATAMSSAFTAANRRKRIATYGKPSRPSANFDWNVEDAPSPERPRKQVGALAGALKRPGTTAGGGAISAGRRLTPPKPKATRDVFDVPSEDELAAPTSSLPSPTRTKKVSPKQAAPLDDFDVPYSSEEANLPKRRLPKAPKAVRKPDTQRPVVPSIKRIPLDERSDIYSSEDPLAAPPRPRAKAAQILQKPSKGGQLKPQAEQRPVAKPKAPSRAITPAATTSSTLEKPKASSSLLKKHAIAKRPPVLDIFDVPSSDGETEQKTPRRPRTALLPRLNTPTRAQASDGQSPPGKHIESDDSNASRKRKRKGSSQPAGHMDNRTEIVEKKKEPFVPQRSKKYQKKQDSVSPGHETGPRIQVLGAPMAASKELAINKPKRTRARTDVKLSIAKGQSSPAKLHSMLALRSMAEPSLARSSELPEISFTEDVTMYEIQETATPPRRKMLSPIAGSVTPRQKQILDNLLGERSEMATPGLPKIGNLRLTDTKPGGVLAGLKRSSSDIPQTTYSRKPRLIDTLKHAPSGSEEDEGDDSDDSENDSSEDSEEDATVVPNVPSSMKPVSSPVATKDVDMADEQPANSQSSQGGLHIGSKVTYAKQRSYLEEENPEDGLLLSMDIDDMLGISGANSSKMSQNVSEDEDEPTSQVRGIHELRRRGQNEQFMLEAQTSIDEIAGKAGLGSSARRSVMIEFCTQLADQKFVEQLLDSALDYQFFSSLASKGEVIFDFAAAVATAFVLNTSPGFAVLNQIYGSEIMATLAKVLELGTDISRIARERKTNLSRVGQESVAELRKIVLDSPIWLHGKPATVSPQIVALRTLELLILNMRQAGSTEALLDENAVSKVLDIAPAPCERLKNGTGSPQDLMILNLAFSILEAVSLCKEKQATWSNKLLRRLVEVMPALFNDAGGDFPIRLASRLCMNLSNNKPKACDIFAAPAFVQPLIRSISQRFVSLAGELVDDQRTEVLETLILSLGAMINLAEFSDQARMSVMKGGDELVVALAEIFVEGSERAAMADSMEESQSSVAIGYLAVLLGNLCLNGTVRREVCTRLPGQKIDMLVDKVREFAQYNERVDRMTRGQFEGEEGRETWQNFTIRLMLVAERLEKVER